MPVATVCRFVRPGSLKAAKLLLFSGHHTNEHKTWSQSCCPFHVLRPSHCPVCEVPTRQNQSVQKTHMSMMSSHSSWPTEASLSARELLAKIQNNIDIIHNIAHFYTLFNKMGNYAGPDCVDSDFLLTAWETRKKSTFSGIESTFLGLETTFSVWQVRSTLVAWLVQELFQPKVYTTQLHSYAVTQLHKV